MIIQTIQGADDINQALTNSMLATLGALVKEGHISEEIATEFSSTHVCMMVDKATMWSKIWARIGFPLDKDVWCPTILRLP